MQRNHYEMNASMSFDDLPLHDAVIKDINILYSESELSVQIRTSAAVHNDPGDYLLVFFGVSSIKLSLNREWGRSESILSHKQDNDCFSMKIQSGDELSIAASGYTMKSILLKTTK